MDLMRQLLGGAEGNGDSDEDQPLMEVTSSSDGKLTTVNSIICTLVSAISSVCHCVSE